MPSCYHDDVDVPMKQMKEARKINYIKYNME
jgi:hypothetical protein